MSRPLLSIVIPAYNEAGRIRATLLDIVRQLGDADFAYEILVVSDGSQDATVEIVREMCGTIEQMTVIVNDENHGKGAAVRQGMLRARGNFRLFMDADNSTSIDHFAAMRRLFDDGYSVVIGSRRAAGSHLDPPAPLYRQILGTVGNVIIQLLVVPGIWDTQCGFKGFTAAAAEALFGASIIDRWAFDVELLALAERLGYRIKEMPVHWVNDVRSSVKSTAYPNTLFEIATIRWRLWTNGYPCLRAAKKTGLK